MSLALPTEVLEVVVDFVSQGLNSDRLSDLRSLCLSCKALVPRCQRCLFQTVALHTPLEEAGFQDSPPFSSRSKRYQSTLSCLRTLVERPHLAGHVELLLCIFDGEHLGTPTANHSDVAQAFEKMCNIQSLTVAHDDASHSGGRLDFSRLSISASPWAAAIAGLLLRGAHLKSLKMQNITHYSSQNIFRCSRLEHLELKNAGIGFDFRWTSFTPFLDAIPRLRSLSCDPNSLFHLCIGISDIIIGLSPAGRIAPVNPTSAILSRVEEADLEMRQYREVRPGDLFLRLGNLKVLRLSLDFVTGRQYDCPLNHLNPTSSGSLTQLTLRLLQKRAIPGDNLEVFLTHPYGCAWKEALSKMTNLEFLAVRLIFQDSFNVSASSFGQQWSDIPDLLGDAGYFPNLKGAQFVFCTHIIGEEKDVGWWSSNRCAAVAGFRRNLEELVYPHHFMPLEALRKSGRRVHVSFKIESSFGDRM